MSKMSREDRLALLNSEVFQELEMAERVKQAQSFEDKIITSPTGQKAISDGIAKALDNKDDDGALESVHDELKGHMEKLTDHELFELFKMFADAVDARGLDTAGFEKEFEDEEAEETPKDEEKEEEDMEDVFAFVKSSLTKLAHSAADKGNTDAAYLIERFVQKISQG